MDHLVCFVPGMLMLGVSEMDKEEVDPRWQTTAAGVTETCYKMYKLARTGLSPEYVRFDKKALLPSGWILAIPSRQERLMDVNNGMTDGLDSMRKLRFPCCRSRRMTDMNIPSDGAHNLLRPEAIEAIYYIEKLSGW